MTLKLYKKIGGHLHYWETWDNDEKSALIHWGRVGERGSSTIVETDDASSYREKVENERAQLKGYAEIDDLYTLVIEYRVDGMGRPKDLAKRHALEERMQATLGWTGLGFCDGGSIGSGSMEVCCFVVDFELAKAVIECDLAVTEFGDFSSIYDENAGFGLQA